MVNITVRIAQKSTAIFAGASNEVFDINNEILFQCIEQIL